MATFVPPEYKRVDDLPHPTVVSKYVAVAFQSSAVARKIKR